VQLVFLVATAASVPMAASISTAFGPGGPPFAVSLAVIYAVGLLLIVLGYDDDSAEFRSAVRYALPGLVTTGLVLAGGFVDQPLRTWLWTASILSVVLATISAGRGTWVVWPGHFAERHGLIIIVALGEVIVAIATPVLSGLEQGAGVPGEVLTSLSAAGVFAGLLWYGYFDRPQVFFERKAASLPAAERGRFARDVWSWIHAPITAGIILAAAALEEITLHPGDQLPIEFRWMLWIGLGFYLGGIELAVYRAFRRVAIERNIAAFVVAAILLTPLDVSGLTLLIAVDLALFVMLLAEHVRLERQGMPVLG
ncbi:MAG: low temperature requirement protein A, partial [Acidimicrobiia bacterium]|nr:low temperature requirement protein A [Acidimicrobiia bacterium]